jgi:hypothetical protein
MISALDRARRISAIARQPTVPHSASSKKRETMLQDFRYALRTIRQAPGFAVVVTLTIAVGVGATTAMFSVVDAVLLRPLPYPAQASLVKLFDTQSGRDVAALSFPEFMDWRDRGSDVFESIGAYGARGEVLSGAGETEQLLGVQASLEVPDSSGCIQSWGAERRPSSASSRTYARAVLTSSPRQLSTYRAPSGLTSTCTLSCGHRVSRARS